MTKDNDIEWLKPRQINRIVMFLVDNNRAKDETSARTYMRTMSKHDLIDAYLMWEGIIGFTEDIVELVENVQKATAK